MELALPSPGSTNGTWLQMQMRHNVIGGMLTWHDTWGPRYGVLPGYGIAMQNGFEDTFTATAMGALEVGAMRYAKGLLDHQWNNFVRYDGLINYRAEELAQQARMLTILALYHSYSGGDDALLLRHFEKAKAMAEWLIARRETTLSYGAADPRYGMMPGVDEGDDFKVQYLHQTPQSHWYSAVAEAYRAFTELGQIWVSVGKMAARGDVAEHGAELLKLAPTLYHDLHASLNKTVNTTASPGHRCYPHRADGVGTCASSECELRRPAFPPRSEELMPPRGTCHGSPRGARCLRLMHARPCRRRHGLQLPHVPRNVLQCAAGL